MRPTLDSVTITTSDAGAAIAFYGAVLETIGFVRTHELVDEEEDDAPVEAVGWGPPDETAQVWVVAGAPTTSGVHLRLETDTRTRVERFHDAAIGAGGAPHTAPRRWTPYRRGEFSAIVRDPAGNLVEVVSPE